MGLIYGDYGGRSDAFKPGSVSFECGSKFLPFHSPTQEKENTP